MYGTHLFINKKKCKAQSALIDAVIFFMLMLIASAVLISFTAFYLKVTPEINYTVQQEYTRNFLTSALMDTINQTYYFQGNAQIFINGTNSVEQLIGIYLNLLYQGIPSSGLSVMKSQIHYIFNMGEIVPYYYALFAYYTPNGYTPKNTPYILFFSDPYTKLSTPSQIPPTTTAYSVMCNVGSQTGYIWLYVWPSGI